MREAIMNGIGCGGINKGGEGGWEKGMERSMNNERNGKS